MSTSPLVRSHPGNQAGKPLRGHLGRDQGQMEQRVPIGKGGRKKSSKLKIVYILVTRRDGAALLPVICLWGGTVDEALDVTCLAFLSEEAVVVDEDDGDEMSDATMDSIATSCTNFSSSSKLSCFTTSSTSSSSVYLS